MVSGFKRILVLERWQLLMVARITTAGLEHQLQRIAGNSSCMTKNSSEQAAPSNR
jgi:hypothetical protein